MYSISTSICPKHGPHVGKYPVHDMEHTEMHDHSPHVSTQIWIPASNEVHLVQHPEEFRRLPPMRAASGISFVCSVEDRPSNLNGKRGFRRTIAGQPGCAH